MFQRWNSSANAIDHLSIIKIALMIGNDTRRGPGKFDELADFRVAMAGQTRDWDAPNFLESEIKNHKLCYVWQLHHDSVQGVKSEIQKIQSQVAGKAIEFGIRDGSRAVDQ